MFLGLLFFLIIALEIFTTFWNILRCICFKNILKKQSSFLKAKSLDTNIIIAIPCLREQNIIEETLNHFLSLVNNKSNIFIVVVTTQKEEFEKKKKFSDIDNICKDLLNNVDVNTLIYRYNELLPTKDIYDLVGYCQNNNKNDIKNYVTKVIDKSLTTFDVVSNWIKNNKINFTNVYLCNYPLNEGFMADQLNYLVQNVQNIIKDKKFDKGKTFLAVYNADSRPGKETINQVFNTIASNKNVKIIQQYSCSTLNWNKLTNLMKGFALYQSNFELRCGLINSSLFSKFLLSYVVGHGLYIRLDKLEEMNGFQTDFWCEDIYMSGYLRNENTKIYSIFAVESMETPLSLKIQIRQSAVWFKTAFQHYKILKHVAKKQKHVSFSGICWLIQEIRATLVWLLLPFFILYSFFYPLFANEKVLLIFISIMSYIFMIVGTYLPTAKLIEKLENNSKINSKIKILFFTSISLLFSSIGPIYSLVNKNSKKYKTSR